MYNTIICEGTDGTGKSVLAQSLATKYGYHYAWFGKPNRGEVFKTYLEGYLELMYYTKVVLDRAHFSEEVYGSLFRDGSELTDDQCQKLCAMLGKSIVIVHCNLPDHIVKGNLVKVPDDLHHDKEPNDIRKKYVEVLKNTGLPILDYNYKTHTVEQLMGMLGIKQGMEEYVASRD